MVAGTESGFWSPGTSRVPGSEPDGRSEFRIGECQLRMFFDIGTNLVRGNEVASDPPSLKRWRTGRRVRRAGMARFEPFHPGPVRAGRATGTNLMQGIGISDKMYAYVRLTGEIFLSQRSLRTAT